jgi:EmrB/QacA subfamily drug resistance transporter
MAVALAALDVTVVSTAMPTIVSELSGVALYSWLISIYLLISTTSTPLYGQLADNWGRKPILLFGISIFIVASLLCAQASTMTQLIVFRGIQGLGAGSIMPMTMTIIGDLFSIEERAKYQGFFSGVWGVSSLVGPAMGAVILKLWSWHGIFLINIPVGLAAFIMLVKVYHEHNVSKHRRVDVWGALFMMAGVALLMLAMERHSPLKGASYLFYVIAAICLVLLILIERKVERPFLPLDLLKKPIIGVAYLVALFGGVVQFGTSAFMPLFVQGAMGGTPVWVGLTMAPVAIGWPIGSVLSGKWILSMGYKRVLAIGMAIGIVSVAMLETLTDASLLPVVMVIVAFIGLSLGLTATPLIIAVQNAVEWGQRGTATALNMFSRTMGGVIGVALMGAMLNSRMSHYFNGTSGSGSSSTGELVNDLLDPVKRGGYQPEVLHAVQHDLAGALHSTYLIPIIAAIVALVLVVFAFPGGKVEKHSVNQSR